MKVIVIPPSPPSNNHTFIVHLTKPNEDVRGEGRSADEALGNLVRTHANIFGLVLEEVRRDREK